MCLCVVWVVFLYLGLLSWNKVCVVVSNVCFVCVAVCFVFCICVVFLIVCWLVCACV